jgi:sugar phosphate isomerase/epimerase
VVNLWNAGFEMQGLEELEIGLMFWAREDANEAIADAKRFGFRSGQLGFPEGLPLAGAAERWDAALTAAQFSVVTAVCSYEGEDYTDIPSVLRTVGLVPPATRARRIAQTKAVSDLASKLGIDSVACHIGFLPHDPGEPLYSEMREVALDLCRYCHANGQFFTLETGQEPAKILLRFIADVHHPNLKINFDPANMILYGTGDPIEALGILGEHVISVHCKDGDWPPMDKPEALGQELPLGEGKVDFPALISTLKKIGYRGVLSIEREGTTSSEQRDRDIQKAIAVLQPLTAANQARTGTSAV